MGSVPPPFKRPSVSLGGPPEKQREWTDMFADDLREGDTVSGFGLITTTAKRENWVALTNVIGVTKTFAAKDVVLSFVEVTS